MKTSPIDFALLQRAPREWLHHARNWSKADVWRAPWPPASGEFVVVKDMRARPFWFRVGVGRYFLAREAHALRALDDVEGVPRLLARPTPDCLVMEWKAGRPALDFAPGEITPRALEHLADLLHQIHARGVMHCDLHRDNVLITPDDTVCLIDWATASVFGSRVSWTRREWEALDDRAIAKMKLRHAPQLIQPHERDQLIGTSPLYSAVRNAGHWLRRLRGAKPKRSPAETAQRFSRRLEKAGLLPDDSKRP